MFKCKKNCPIKPKPQWLTFDTNSNQSMVNANAITLITIDENKVNMKLMDGNTASIDTANADEAKNVFIAIFNKLQELA